MVTEIVELLRKKVRQIFILSVRLLAAETAPNANDSTASRHISEDKHVPVTAGTTVGDRIGSVTF